MREIHSLSVFLNDLNHRPSELPQLILVLSGASWGSTFFGCRTRPLLQCPDPHSSVLEGSYKSRPAESG